MLLVMYRLYLISLREEECENSVKGARLTIQLC